MRLYDDLARWYRLLTPVDGYVDEAASYLRAFEEASTSPPTSLFELGAGAGHNAFHLKPHFSRSIVLTDLSPKMLDLSRAINDEPRIEHVVGDMRTLRLDGDRTFDCVLVHDAIMYMSTEDDLRKAITTAFVHTRPGGVAVFAPDYVEETFQDGAADSGGSDSEDGGRGIRYLEWVHDPDPKDSTYMVEYALLLREGASVTVEHDRHLEGLFSRATWQRLFTEVGYELRPSATRPRNDEGDVDEFFVLRRPQ